MSILTKFLVVLVTVLSIVLVALVVPLLATQDNLAQQVQEERNLRIAAEKAAGITAAELRQVQSGSSSTIQRLNQTIAERTADVDRETAAKVQAQAEARAAQSQLVELKAAFQTIAATGDEQTRINKLLSDQLAQSQQTIQTQGSRLITLADANDALTSERDTLVRRVRQFQEQGIALQEQVARLEGSLAQIPAEVRREFLEAPTRVAPTRSPVPIAGQVVAVEDLGSGVVLVQVNVGQSDSVTEGMEFLVHRDDNFKGTLVIDRVEPRRSVGRMELVKSAIKTGDDVYTGPY